MKIIWALEPTHQEPKRLKSMYQALTMLGGAPAGPSGTDLEVAMVVTHTESWLSLAFDVPLADRFTVYPKSMISKSLKQAGITLDSKKISVIDFQTYSTNKSVGRLLEFAEAKEADLIGLYTHAKTGFQKFVLGSFSETMIHKSETSLVLFSPKFKATKKIKSVLFASDFGEGTLKHLKKVLEYCKRLKAELHVFHHAEPIFKWALDEKDKEVVAYRQKIIQMKAKILKECQDADIVCDVQVSASLKPTAELILKAGERQKVQLIALFAKGGTALMGGRVTRQVVRSSELPILVLH